MNKRTQYFCVDKKGVAMMLTFWKSLHGINLWKLNRMFIKLAVSKISLEEQIQNGMLKIEFKPKQAISLIGTEQKKEIEQAIEQLEGFEILKLCLFEECVPVYREQRSLGIVSRWLEIHIKRDNEQQKAS
jgi:hypothetical protein